MATWEQYEHSTVVYPTEGKNLIKTSCSNKWPYFHHSVVKYPKSKGLQRQQCSLAAVLLVYLGIVVIIRCGLPAHELMLLAQILSTIYIDCIAKAAVLDQKNSAIKRSRFKLVVPVGGFAASDWLFTFYIHKNFFQKQTYFGSHSTSTTSWALAFPNSLMVPLSISHTTRITQTTNIGLNLHLLLGLSGSVSLPVSSSSKWVVCSLSSKPRVSYL